MALFTAPGPNGETLQIDAPDEASAAQALQEMAGGAGQGGGLFDDLPTREEARGGGAPAPAAQPQPQAPGGGMFDDVGQSPRDRFATAFDSSQDSAETAEGLDERVYGDADDRGRWATAGNALTMGFGDEVMGLMAGGLTFAQGKGFDEGYDKMTRAIRGDIDAYAERRPIEHAAIDIAASLPTAMVPGGAAVRGAGLGTKVVRGAAAGAGYGAVRGFGEGEGDATNRLEEAGSGALIGAGIGAAAPAIGAGIGRAVGKRAGRSALPTDEAIANESRALFNAAERSGVAIKDRALQRLSAVGPRLQGANRNLPRLRPQLHPNALEAIKVVDDVSRQPTITFADLMTTRQVLRDAVNTAYKADPKGADYHYADQVLDLFDAWRNGIKGSDAYPGVVSPAEANRMLSEANRLWAIKRKTDIINDIVFRAEGNVGSTGFEQSLRTQIRALVGNKSRMASFTKEEVKALRKVANGGPVRWLLQATKAAMPSPGLATTASAVMVNPAPLALSGARGAAGYGVNRSTRRAFDQAKGVINAGGGVPFDPVAAKAAGDYSTRLGMGAALPAGESGRGQILDLGNVLDRGQPPAYIPAR